MTQDEPDELLSLRLLAGRKRISVEELARQQGVRPYKSAADLAHPGIFDSDEELDEFLADLYASRRAGF